MGDHVILEDYWVYNNIYIPMEIKQIPAFDKCNWIHYNDKYRYTITFMHSKQTPYTFEEYCNRYCEYDTENDRWIYVGNKN
jgi:hypothetical protein